MFSKDDILRDLATKKIGRKIYVFETIDSTNLCAKTLARAGADDGTVVVADYQTSGRGRLGRSWDATPGSSILFSTVLRPHLREAHAGLLTFFAAVSVARAVEEQTRLPVECKWPNDLLLNGKKFCGILLENSFNGSTLDHSVAGIGLNVEHNAFPGELRHRATSISNESGRKEDRLQLFRRILDQMDQLYPEIASESFERIVDEWRSRCGMFGHAVKVLQNEKKVEGSAVGLSPEGGLILKTAEGTTTVYAGEVTVVPE